VLLATQITILSVLDRPVNEPENRWRSHVSSNVSSAPPAGTAAGALTSNPHPTKSVNHCKCCDPTTVLFCLLRCIPDLFWTLQLMVELASSTGAACGACHCVA